MKSLIKKIVAKILELLGRGVLARYKPTIIAITGNVGKTSTKDAIYVALRGEGSVRRSEKSFNSEIGVPLSILGAKSGWNNILSWFGVLGDGIWQVIGPRVSYPKTLVLEVGADRPGDIARIAKWLRPHVVVITRLPEIPVHIEFFPSVEMLREEKFSLAKYMRRDGTLVLNADDERVMEAKNRFHMRTLTYGTSPEAMLRASNIQMLAPGQAGTHGGIAYKLDFDGKSLPVVLSGVYAESFVSVSLAALAASAAVGANLVHAIDALREYEVPPGRVRPILGFGDTTLIDDTYNSSPAACEAGLLMLRDIPFGSRKIAVLGDMLELGKHTNEAHYEIGKLTRKCADILVAVGPRAKEIAHGAKDARIAAKHIFTVDTAEEAGELLRSNMMTGDVVYLKGSQGMRMERTVKMLMAEPERASELLVRQEEEWQKR